MTPSTQSPLSNYTSIPIGDLPCAVCLNRPATINTPYVSFDDPVFGTQSIPYWPLCTSCAVWLDNRCYMLLGLAYISSHLPSLAPSTHQSIPTLQQARLQLSALNLMHRLHISRQTKSN